MLVSQNGWSVITDDARLARLVVLGVEFPQGVRVELLPLFLDLATRLAVIERPRLGDCWGHAVRPIRGRTSGYSNHASGTAIDWNAPLHPRQPSRRHAGFSLVQVYRIRRLLRRYQGVIRWGGDYGSAPYDPMHFEVVAGLEVVRALIAELAVPPYPGKALRLGSRSAAVEAWKRAMNERHGWDLPVNRVYWLAARRACRIFQRNHGLGVDGIVGPLTWEATFS